MSVESTGRILLVNAPRPRANAGGIRINTCTFTSRVRKLVESTRCVPMISMARRAWAPNMDRRDMHVQSPDLHINSLNLHTYICTCVHA